MAYEVEEAKKLVIEAGLRLLNEGLIVRTWGNISARISDTQFVITPSGRGYTDLTPDDIVVVDIKKCTYEGNIKPSSECGIHADVFAKRPEVNFIIHTHQVYASVVSVLGQDIELSEEEKTFLGERIPCATYGMSSTPKLRKQVKKCLRKSAGCSSMLLRNHGVLCMGTDFENAFEISSVMEQICKYNYENLVSGFSAINPVAFLEDTTEVSNEINATAQMNEAVSVEEKDAAVLGETTVSSEEEALVTTNEETAVTDEVSSDAESVGADEIAESTEAAGTDDIKEDGYIDYGTSFIEGDEITLTLKDKEYKYKLGDKKPISKSIFSRGKNKIALLHSRIYEDRKVSHIYQVTLPNIVDASSKIEKGFPAYIDDQAQIVGEYVKCVGKIGKKPHFESASSIAKGLKGKNAVLVAGQGAIVTGNSEEDLEATAYVLEKGCMAAKLAVCHPEAKSVPKRIAKKEREFYLETYSRLK